MGVHWKEAFTTSSTILAIYIQQFWDTMYFNSSIGLYNYQLDEQWFNLHKDLLRDALDITPTNDNNPFVAPPSSDTVIEYVNTLGYPCTLRNVSAMSVNALYQPWRVVLSMINMCLTEFVQSIQTFLTDRKNLATASRGKKKTAHLLIPSVRFTKLIIHHLKTKHNIHLRTGSPLHYSHDENVPNTLRFVGKDGREIFGMPIPDTLLTDDIKGAPYYDEYLEHVAKYQQHLDAEHGMEDEGGATESPKATKVAKPKVAKVTKPAGDKAPKPTSSQPPKPTPTQIESSKKDQGKKRKLVKETSDAPSLAKRAKASKVTKQRMPKSSLQLVDEFVDEDVQGKGKEKVVDEQAAHDLLTLHTPKQKSPADQFIFQRRTPMPTESSRHAESPSLDAELALTDSETESDEEAPEIHAGDHDEGQAGPNPGKQDEGQARPNPQIDEEFTTTAYPNVQDNLKLPTKDQVIIEELVSSTGTLSSLQNLDKELSFTNQFFIEKPQEEELRKPILNQRTIHGPLPTSTTTVTTTTTTTSLPPPPPKPQQITTDPILVRHIASDKAIDEIVTDAVDWAMQAPLRARLSDLPAIDIKEILQQRMFEDKSYEAHEDHKNLFDALQKSLERDYSNQLLADLDKARKKKRKRCESPRTPPV
ncbi:hypothetical protein Tco_0835370 [Tanacetum coccineum]